MKTINNQPLQRYLVPLLALVSSTLAYGQAAPDAGSISREFERGSKVIELPRQSLPPVVADQAPRTTHTAEGTRFRVSGFKFSGVTVFAESDLQLMLADLLAKEVSLSDLQTALDRLSQKYRQHGYFVARAYLPAQDVKDGIVSIAILEGTVADINVRPTNSVRLDKDIAVKTMRDALSKDAIVQEPLVERGLLLIYDLPGMTARSTISPGREVGTSTLTLDLAEGPLVSGSVDLDNYGSQFSGRDRLGVSVNINNPSGVGDQIKLRAAHSIDTRNLRVGYQLPLGTSGLKLGVDHTTTDYKLCCQFAALNANGEASSTAGYLAYPFIRSRDANLYGILSFAERKFLNTAANVTTGDSRIEMTSLSLSGNARDSFGGGGITGFSASLALGSLDLDRAAADRAQDAATANTHGSFRKISYALSRQQSIVTDTVLRANLSGQVASKNLASAEKFVLGGNDGVRAYPTGEAVGDEGWLIGLELAHQWNPSLEAFGFLDHGEVLVHHEPWPGAVAGSLTRKNRYALSGGGLGLKWSRPNNYLFRGTVAFPINDNPGRNLRGEDVDGKTSNLRVWLQAIKEF
jgi:hemolysin activation/secretion protein